MEPGAQNGVIGDSFGTDLPSTTVDEGILNTEKNMARFSTTKEFKVLKSHIEDRIAFFQTYLPDGRSIAAMEVKPQELVNNWIIATTLIGEFNLILQSYENAATSVKKKS